MYYILNCVTQLSESKKEVEDLRSQLGIKSNEHQETLGSLRAKLSQLTDSHQQLTEEKQQLTTEKQQLTANCTARDAELRKLQTCVQEVQSAADRKKEQDGLRIGVLAEQLKVNIEI